MVKKIGRLATTPANRFNSLLSSGTEKMTTGQYSNKRRNTPGEHNVFLTTSMKLIHKSDTLDIQYSCTLPPDPTYTRETHYAVTPSSSQSHPSSYSPSPEATHIHQHSESSSNNQHQTPGFVQRCKGAAVLVAQSVACLTSTAQSHF